jgi:hypothetical protein
MQITQNNHYMEQRRVKLLETRSLGRMSKDLINALGAIMLTTYVLRFSRSVGSQFQEYDACQSVSPNMGYIVNILYGSHRCTPNSMRILHNMDTLVS